MSKKEELISKGYKAYENNEIIVFWKPDLCEHAAECIRGNNQVFDVNRRPWVDVSAASAEEISKIIDKCPSGALKYEIK
ncbi:(4Fe-4S)-binding protein [Methanobrevibacter sp.]|uniref:(4Fe-4S)-binding protein n=1 Tax=Methanobrevibacter sp. TaxID=66852 RepID=UPI0025DF7F75|nr:(4Fe-4S)-binding protein [Methanobrevibacter sp.]MBR4447874.1 (4Fe-4S)-binding protein [Methanobrevibacter sp.]